MPRKAHSFGFTLVELLVVIAILVIVATIGIPNFGPTVANSRANTAANDLLGALQLARSEAVKLNASVVVTAANPSDWAAGWTITTTAGATTTTIRQRDAFQRVTITNGPPTIVFRSAGNATTVDSAGIATPNTPFIITANGGGDPSRCLAVTASGSAAVTPGDCS